MRSSDGRCPGDCLGSPNRRLAKQPSVWRVARCLPILRGWSSWERGERRHPVDADLSVAFVGAVPVGTLSSPGDSVAWFPVLELPQLAPRQRTIVAAALELVRQRVDYAPIAFRMLPPTFTLSDLQRVYEILLGHRLHKASFRRTLAAASLVEATDEWRTQGRGRPAQLFRLAAKRRRRPRRGVRFDTLP